MRAAAAKAVDWLERAIPVVRGARAVLLMGTAASVAGTALTFFGFIWLGARGAWFILVIPFCAVLAVPALLLWSTRQAMAAVLELPDAVRGLVELDDVLLKRVDAVKVAAARRSGLIGTVRNAVSLLGEVRGSLDEELAPFSSAVGTLAPARLAASVFAMLLAGGVFVVGLAVMALAVVV
ncbi:MAG: hypothetical protein GY708_24680 [Actinomycetia bacterium]|nr:hypothetical protein [Actinomycetes bacterium]MCP4960011.1 hypothetical protein [Actinomycetes bacterium]